MNYSRKTKAQLIAELEDLRRRNAELEKMEAGRRRLGNELRQNEKRFQNLAESEERFRAMADAIPCAIYRCAPAPDWSMEFISRPIEHISGYPADDFIHNPARDFADIIHPDDLPRVNGAIAAAMSAGRSWKLKYRLRHRDGSIRWVRDQGRAAPKREGQPDYRDGFILNDTQRKLAEEALRASREKLAKVFRTIPISISITLLEDGRFLEVNDALCKINGYTREETLGRTSLELGLWPNPETRKKIRDELQSGRPIRDRVVKLRRKSGEEYFALLSADLIDIDSKPCMLAAVRDISARGKAEAEKNRLTTIIETTNDLVCTAAPDAGITYLNRAGRALLGWGAEENLADKTVDDIHPDWALEIIRGHGLGVAMKQGSWAGRTAVKGPGGREIPVSQVIMAHRSEDGRLEYFSSIMRDISDRRRDERLLRIQRDAALSMAGASRLEDALPVCLKAAMEFSGMERGGVFLLDGRTGELELVHSQGLPGDVLSQVSRFASEAPVTREVLKAKPLYILQDNLAAGGDDPLAPNDWFRILALTPIVHRGRAIGCIGVASLQKGSIEQSARVGLESLAAHLGDAIARIQTEENLRRSEKRYRDLFNAITDFVYTHDLSGRILSVNPAAARGLGYTAEEVLGRPISDFMREEDREAFAKEYLAEIQQRGTHEGIFILRSREGAKHYIEYRSSLTGEDGSQPYVSGTGRDATQRIKAEQELRRMEEQLIQSQKMEAVGILAGGIAHDFNNILQAITGYIQLMAASSAPQDQERLTRIEEAAGRAAKLVRQLLTFSRKGELRPETLDINSEVEQAVEMLKRTIPKMIQIETKLADDLWNISGDRTQMEQVVMNLGINAADAMPDGGLLTIETENATLDKQYTASHLETRAGDYVLLRVTDNGAGMDKETINHIFEPFFTTKAPGEGTGLGLATVYGIVGGHGGHITCHSEPGRGAVFNVYLPALRSARRNQEASGRPPSPDMLRGDESILLVDDEKSILDIGGEFFRQYGYSVFTASSGEEALSLFQDGPGRPDLVILDLGMPGMGGQKCLEEMLKINPEARVIIASGYAADGQLEDVLAKGAVGFIAKPFRLEDMLTKAREALDGK